MGARQITLHGEGDIAELFYSFSPDIAAPKEHFKC